MQNNIINLVFITDAGYIPITMVAIYSAIKNKNPNSIYQINVLCIDVSEKQINELKKLEIQNATINIIRQDIKKYNNIANNYYVTTAALFKFDLPKILNKLDKALYLDGDIIVQKDLTELYNTELENCCAGVVFHNYWKDNERLGLNNYFNSGVMLLNLSKLRKEKYYKKLINEKLQNKTLKYMDNDVFNVVFAENVVSLAEKYNYLNIYNHPSINTTPQCDTANICILHYASGLKPWKFPDTINADIWYEYFNKLKNTRKYKYTISLLTPVPKQQKKLKDFQYDIQKLLRKLFYKNKGNKKKFKLLGLPICSIKSKDNKKVFKILGLKFSFKNKVDKLGGGNPWFNLIHILVSPSEFRFLSEYIKSRKENKKRLEILLSGLEAEVAKKVKTIVLRLDKIVTVPLENKNELFTTAEIKQFTKANDDLKNGILKREDGNFEFNKMVLPINHFESSVFIYEHNLNGLKTLNKISDKVILDVGGFIGDSILIFRKHLNNPIVCFEPVLENYHHVKSTIKLNNIQDVTVENLALGSEACIMPISICGSGSSFKHNQTENFETVNIVTLDSYVKKHNLKIGLIKVDIEGFEQSFLKGAVKTIKEQKPILLISIYHNYFDFYEIKPFIESLNLGYKFDVFKPVDGQILSETLLICEIY